MEKTMFSMTENKMRNCAHDLVNRQGEAKGCSNMQQHNMEMYIQEDNMIMT